MGELTQPPQPKRSARVILIPGFLTEPITMRLFKGQRGAPEAPDRASGLPLEALDTFDPTKALDARAWRVEFLKVIGGGPHTVTCFDWASQNLIELIAQCGGVIYSQRRRLSLNVLDIAHELGMTVYQTWREATHQADKSVTPLYEQLVALSDEAPDQVIDLIGHSLGARVALRLAERLAEQPVRAPVRISAWAPAINQGELNWGLISELASPPEVFYTRGDLILKYLFKLGETSLSGIKPIDVLSLTASMAKQSRAVGLIGAGEGYPTQLQISLDDTPIGHLSYLSEMPTLFERSRHLSSLIKP